MKKKIASVILIVFCVVLCLAGCNNGNYIDKGNLGGNTPVTPIDPVNPDNPDIGGDTQNANDYTVSVYYNNSLFDPKEEDIFVVWKSNTQVKKVRLGGDGKANAGELDGTYGVYLEGLPSKYSYNPSAYTATSDARKVTLLITDIRTPESGDGSGLYMGQGCYSVKYDGTYRAQINNSAHTLYYEYQPTAAGVYSVESWVSVYDNEINPYVVQYSGSSAYKKIGDRVDDGGYALAGGYTRNFRMEYRITDDEVNGTFTFAVGAECKTQSDYPVYVDFAITYEGEHKSDYSDVRTVRAKEALTRAANSQSEFIWADMETKVFDMSKFRYNEDTGFYHRYDAELYAANALGYGAGYGPILCCMIRKQSPSYSITSLYDANSVGLGYNYLRMYCKLEAENKYAVLDYTDFIRVDYARVCNSSGVCYVTKELQEFLQYYAETHSLYTDGAGAAMGSPEIMGYSANQDALWLFACGFYS
ncbi:MAG: hypothetical protein NC037_03900 [Bacteroides sp.]|nr:hypothetical protein [Bacillota bacterium]MCM1393998.1 hypothetical protein [[Eubacterium] siraeum]MCM1455653.1 hypothetical protein [Bacteroides sp.]